MIVYISHDRIEYADYGNTEILIPIQRTRDRSHHVPFLLYLC